jgi:ABC-2 type transport system ATP-binding protein
VAATIELRGLAKSFGATTAVHDLSATVRPGAVTAFLGPNGAGKTTTLRMLLGLVAPTRGVATIGGRLYRDLEHPVRQVGAALEATGFHPGRAARDHLRALAVAAGLDDGAADRALAAVELTDVARRRVGGYSLGMRQRLGLAAALLGDPPVLVLDEPTNGLDPQGIRWLRTLLRAFAEEGRTVLLSSHVLSEVELIADDVLVMRRGHLVRAASLVELRTAAGVRTEVRAEDPDLLERALREACLPARRAGDSFQVEAEPPAVGAVAAKAGIVLHRLSEVGSLEETFFGLTGGD